MNMNRAYSTFEIKSSREEEGIIEGLASTPTPDRIGDVMEPGGALFKLPMPLLWQHDSKSPIGQVLEAKVTPAGIWIKAKIARGILPEIDRAWALIKAGLVRGLSIGFQGIDAEKIRGADGIRYKKWSWVELSSVTIPMNMEASVASIKAADFAALGKSPNGDGDVSRASSGVTRVSSTIVTKKNPGVSGQTSTHPKGPIMGTKTIQDQLSAFAAKRQANTDRLSEIMTKSADEGSTLDESQREEYETLKAECSSIDEHMTRLKDYEQILIKNAAPVTKANVDNDGGVNVRKGSIISVHSNLPKGTGFTRYAIALARSKGNLVQAVEIAKQWTDSPEVLTCLKGGVAIGTTTDANWATELADYTYMASEFVELLRPATIVGRIQGLRRVPFMIRMPKAASGVSAGWVGQGAGKPVGKMDFDTVTLPQHKIACIVVLTEELVRFSNPAAEAVVRQDMIDAISQYMDQQFIDPTVTYSAGVRPAAITQGVSGTAFSGVTVANVLTDVAVMMNRLITGNISLKAGVWVMHPRTALFLSMMRTAQDVYAFPNITMTGGTFYGLPVVTSANMPIDTGNDTYIVLMDASEIYLADDGGVTLDVSREASLEMVDNPTGGGTAVSLVSLWQNNLVGLRAERFITWKRRRDAAVALLEDISY